MIDKGMVTTGVRYNLMTFFRNPFNLAALILLPLIAIEGMGYALGTMPELPGIIAMPEEEGRMMGALFSTSFLTGLMGLFQVISSREADRRLNVVGGGRFGLLFMRVSTILIVGIFVTMINYLIFIRGVDPASHHLIVLSLLSVSIMYGFFGVIIGVIVPHDLEGSLVMVFLADMDVFLGSGVFETEEWIQRTFPTHYPSRILEEGVVEGTFTSDYALFSILYMIVLFTAALSIFYVTSRGDLG